MQMNNQFRVSLITLGVLALFGSGQAIAADASVAADRADTNGQTNNVTVSTADSLNTSGVGATTVGNGTGSTLINAGTTVSINGPTSASMTSGANGYKTYTTTQTVAATGTGAAANQYVLTNGTSAATQSLITSTAAGIKNVMTGNTLIDGNVYINGTLNYSSSTSATTTVSGTGATGTTSAGMTVVNAGQAGGVSVDANGKMTANATPTQTTSALTVTNTTTGQTHGFVVNETQAVMSGGTRSTSLTLNDNGATFSNSATGAPVTVTGVADGTQDFDAVNYRQLKQVAAGVAGVSAMANIPAVDQNKTFAFGAGIGQFQNQTALALGGSWRIAQNAVVKASVATSSGNNTSKSTVYGVGAGLSW